MSTVQDVVTLALRQARVLGIGRDPRSTEAAAGLQAYQGMLDMWVSNGMFGQLIDVYLTANATAVEGRRYLLASGVTLTIPTLIPRAHGDDYGESGSASDNRQPYDLSLIESLTSGGVRTVKLYDRIGWVDLLSLTLATDPAPLSARGVTGLAACIAQTYAEMFGAQLMPYTARLASQFQGMISRKFGTARPKEAATFY